jgi:asparagine synthase (glutamine-hydrolysing)
MAGIAGTARPDSWNEVRALLTRISHRGEDEAIAEQAGATVGEVHSDNVKMWLGRTGGCRAVCDGVIHNWRSLAPDCHDVDQALDTAYKLEGPGFVSRLRGPFAIAMALDNGVFLARDGLGIAPLYYVYADDAICFASEVKALVGKGTRIHEFPPGHYYLPGSGFVRFHSLRESQSPAAGPEEAAGDVRRRLNEAVSRCIEISDGIGCWLSGGLDSSILAALLRLQRHEVDTFSIGLPGASDLEWAKMVAGHIGSRHHEIRITIDDLTNILEEVVYHLESFDALLVRSSLTNFLLGKVASDHVGTVLSGEGGDELFAGYDYLAEICPSDLQDELRDITSRLHNTALQRVDRCSRAHGLVAHTPFLDRDVVDYALGLPPDYKLHRNGQVVAKWVLRRAANPLLPDKVLNRPKEKFWKGTGVSETIAHHAADLISDAEFESSRILPDGSSLASKEEYLYFKVFTDHFGRFDDYSFVGRTKQVGS